MELSHQRINKRYFGKWNI